MEILINTSLHVLMSADSLAAKYLNITNMSQKRSGLDTTYINEYNRLNNYFTELFPANKQDHSSYSCQNMAPFSF